MGTWEENLVSIIYTESGLVITKLKTNGSYLKHLKKLNNFTLMDISILSEEQDYVLPPETIILISFKLIVEMYKIYYGQLKKKLTDLSSKIKPKDKWTLWELKFTDMLDKTSTDKFGLLNQLTTENMLPSEITFKINA